MQWWDIYVQVPESMSDAVSEYLQGLGSSAVVVYDDAALAPRQGPCIDDEPPTPRQTVLHGALPQTGLAAHVVALQQFLQTCAVSPSRLAWKLYCRPLLDHDYLTQWQHFFPPLRIGEHLVIRPSWDTSPVPHDTACLTLDPGLAFGTGTHPTTRMCLTLLVQWRTRYQGGALLDVGCGSGILSLAALKLGWCTAVGVDINPQAVTVATANAA
jgi:ribosomal protein L11 methyltransferase